MKRFGSKEQCGYRVDTIDRLCCKKEDSDFNICGNCQSCIFTSKLQDSTQWMSRAGYSSKRRFLTGILVRCQSVEILETIQRVLQVTFGKDFTYTRSRQKSSVSEDMTTWSQDRALDTKLLGIEMVDTWDWFSRSHHWTKSNYLLGILSLCDTGLLHMLGNLTSVLIVRAKRAFLQLNVLEDEDYEDDTSSIPESTYSFNSQEGHPDLDLLIWASSFYDPVNMHHDTDINTIDGGQETCHDPELSNSCQLHVAPWAVVGASPTSEGLQGFGSVCLGVVKEDSDTDSTCSDDPALMVVPRSSTSLSGVRRYRDFIRGLPVHLAKRILGLLDKTSLYSCRDVSQHWRYLTEDTQEDLNAKKMVEKQATLMQSNNTGVSPTYAKVRKVLVPIREDEKHMHHVEIFSKIRQERGFEAIYAGVRTRAIQMEERNVYCGVYNVLVLLDREDPSRVVHYSGGQLVAVGSKDRVVRLLDVLTLKEVSPVIQGHAGSIRALLLCEERGLVISASYDLSIRCWNLKTGVCLMLFRGHLGTINCLDLHGNCLVSGANDCKVKVWNLQTGHCYEKLKFRHHNPILCVKIDKALVMSSCDKGLVKMWGMETASLLKVIDAHQSSVKCLFFDQWHILSGGSDGQVMAWSTNCDIKKNLMTYCHPKEVLALIYLFLRVITGCGDGKIRIFNFLTGDCLRVIKAGGQHSPIQSLHTHSNNMVVNTGTSVLIYQFTRVRWDYSVLAEREFFNEFRGTLKSMLNKDKYPYSYVRAERMTQVGSSNRKIYDREGKKPERPALSHHARSLSAPSMRRAQAVQQESMRPATWSELQGHRRSRAYIDLQPEFITKPPSAISPGRPVSGHSQGSQSRASHTPRSETTGSARELSVTTKWVLTRSEKAVKDRVKKRGPHRPVTPQHVLLKVNSTHQPQGSDQAGANMNLNAQVRDAWGSPPPLPVQGMDPEPHASPFPPTTPKQSPQSQSQKAPAGPSHQVLQHGMTKTYVPLMTRTLDLNLRQSLDSREICSSSPSPAVMRPHTSHAASTQRTPCPKSEKKRPQTSCGIAGLAVRKVGAFTTTAQSNVQAPQRMFMKVSSKRPGRHVNFEMPNKTISQYNPLDPFRERGAFRLHTDTQLEEYFRVQNHQLNQQGEGCYRTREDQDRQRKGVWKRKVKGVPALDFPKQDQVYAPELGHEIYI
ncbi:F-box and WD repeat domain containing protein 10B isoform X2 [Oncorhynchus keta]|uniref:F-box and WD repeat domain containing protein 10B isoform X2 n=1 Tax=Oncorhynchus keta TaxID=8018 RepID=UPI0015FA05F5|nr:F-box and WD repeat domain containing protein 10B isoform X2 [Oncorhynchus keta]